MTTFQRSPHDKENPYAQISRDLIRDQSISPNCRWLLIYLLSMSDNWVIKIEQLVNHCKGFLGRDKIYKVVQEACDAGYMQRHDHKKGNLRRCVYYVSETASFKKSFRLPENQEAGDFPRENAPTDKFGRLPDFQDPEHTDDKERTTSSKEEEKKEQYKNNTPISPKGEKRPSSSRRRKIKEDLEEKAPRIWVTPSQHEDLLRRCESDETFLTQAYDLYSQWKVKKGIDGGRGDYTNMIDWVFEATRKKLKKERNQCEQFLSDKAILKTVEEKYPHYQEGGCSLTVGHNYIEFVRGTHCERITLGDFGFREQVLNGLRKLNLSLGEL